MVQRFQRSAAVEAAPLQDESLLFQPTTNKFHVLNGTASYIWERLQTPTSAEQIAQGLCSDFEGVSEGQALRDVETTLKEMLGLSMVVTVDDPKGEEAT